MIPIKTDTPLYHPPIATLGLILINCLVHVLVIAAGGVPDFFCLQFGQLNPVQWFSSLFLHVGIVHLIGNMIFLWTFGMIVEGKVGLKRFLLIYLLVGMTESAISQLLMLGGSGAAVGASGAIFGLLAISLVWSEKMN